MARTHNVNVEIRAEIADFRKKLMEAENLTDKQAKKMANAFSKQMKRMEKAARADLNPKGLKEFEDAAGEVDTIVSALAGGLSELSPELGGLVSLGAESASVFEAVARSGSKFAGVLGPLVVVIGLAAAAYEHFKREAEDSTEALEAQAKAAEEADRAFEAMASSIEDVQYQNLLLTGIMDDLAIQQLKTEDKLAQGFAKQKEIKQAEIDATNELIKVREREFAQIKEESDNLVIRDNKLVELNETLKKQEAELAAVNEQERAAIATNKENIEIIKQRREAAEKDKKAKERKRKADKKAAETAREAAQADRDAAQAERERTQAMAEADAAAEKLIKSERELIALTNDLLLSAESMGDLNAMEQLEKTQTAFMANFESQALKALELTEKTGGDIVSLDAKLASERLDIEAAFLNQRAELQDEADKAELDEKLAKLKFWSNLSTNFINEMATFELEKRTQTLRALQGIEATMGQQMNEGERALLTARIEAQRKGAERAFKVQQAGAVAQIGMDTAVAIIKTMSQFGFPLGLIPAGLMGAMGGVQVAKVMRQAPPSFHTGGMVSDVTNDEANIRVLRSEAILNPTAVSALGREGVNSLNQGQGLAPQMVVVQYRNRVLDVTLQDVSRRPGPLRSALAQRNKLGHSNRRR